MAKKKPLSVHSSFSEPRDVLHNQVTVEVESQVEGLPKYSQ